MLPVGQLSCHACFLPYAGCPSRYRSLPYAVPPSQLLKLPIKIDPRLACIIPHPRSLSCLMGLGGVLARKVRELFQPESWRVLELLLSQLTALVDQQTSHRVKEAPSIGFLCHLFTGKLFTRLALGNCS